MPTATGRETATEKDARIRAENWAAYRSAIADEMRQTAADHAELAHDEPDAIRAVEYLAGEEYILTAGARRKIKVDEGKVRAVALADAVEARRHTVISHGMTFGLFAGRGTTRYHITVSSRR